MSPLMGYGMTLGDPMSVSVNAFYQKKQEHV